MYNNSSAPFSFHRLQASLSLPFALISFIPYVYPNVLFFIFFLSLFLPSQWKEKRGVFSAEIPDISLTNTSPHFHWPTVHWKEVSWENNVLPYNPLACSNSSTTVPSSYCNCLKLMCLNPHLSIARHQKDLANQPPKFSKRNGMGKIVESI